jgi:(3,5-dihydroxyphenyl)acetyl-CoA 1,2-dioxygenase
LNYEELTDGFRRDLRVEALARMAAPTDELKQGEFLSRVLSDRRAGLHLCHAMLRPTSEALAVKDRFRETGFADLGHARVERLGNAGHVILHNPVFLNAEDEPTTRALEVGVDLVLLDPACEVGVLRGDVVSHPKYAGRRVFNAGLNLTHLYEGKIPFAGFMMPRELGLVSKIYRGLWLSDDWESGLEDFVEKPWIAAVEAFAIGGGCQLLLVHDRVIAERGAYLTLPARKEGIVPGASNARLWRFLGDRAARQAITFERGFSVDEPDGRLIVDRVVEPGEMDAALTEDAERIVSSGAQAAASNRRMIRLGQEPMDLFRVYMANYAREQSRCLHDPAVRRNLEANWLSR